MLKLIKLRTVSRGLIRYVTDRTLMGRDLRTTVKGLTAADGPIVTPVKNFLSLTFMLAKIEHFYKNQNAAWEVAPSVLHICQQYFVLK